MMQRPQGRCFRFRRRALAPRGRGGDREVSSACPQILRAPSRARNGLAAAESVLRDPLLTHSTGPGASAGGKRGEFRGCASEDGGGRAPRFFALRLARETRGGVNSVAVPRKRGRASPKILRAPSRARNARRGEFRGCASEEGAGKPPRFFALRLARETRGGVNSEAVPRKRGRASPRAILLTSPRRGCARTASRRSCRSTSRSWAGGSSRSCRGAC
jgi:hypothetical protein